ncbi:MAG: ankyrin repeat domain-containing protein [Bradymonadia bacterium]
MRASLLSAFAVVIASACIPQPPFDDAGDRAFVVQVVSELLGRRLESRAEEETLLKIVEIVGRGPLVDALMDTDDFTEHWGVLMLDHLQVQRSGERAAVRECFGEARRKGSDGQIAFDDGELAHFVSTHNAEEHPFGEALDEIPDWAEAAAADWNMRDLIYSSIRADNLAPIYEAYLYPLVTRTGHEIQPGEEAVVVGSAMANIYLNREVGCLQCHNDAFNVTPPDRFFPLRPGLDEAIWGSATGPELPTTAAFDQAPGGGFVAFHQKILGGPLKPWNINPWCASGNNYAPSTPGFLPPEQAPSYEGELSHFQSANFAGITGHQASIHDVARAFSAGVSGLEADDSPLKVEGVPLSGPEALAYMTAATVVENIWAQIMGERLTVAHRFARTSEQMMLHVSLLEGEFLPHRWSLKKVVRAIVLSQWFNRQSPAHGDAGLGSPHHLPTVLDPWSKLLDLVDLPDGVDENDPKLHFNSQGAIVHRRHPMTLLRSISEALLWPTTEVFAKEDALTGPFGSGRFAHEVGQYLSDYEPGTTGVTFQGLLAWERELGSCAKPEAMGDAPDWIDHLVTQAEGDGLQPSVRDAVKALKYRLISDSCIDSAVGEGGDVSEEALIEAILGVDDLDGELNTLGGSVAASTKLRQLCGVFLESPQFMLAGLPPAPTCDTPPGVEVCVEPPCTVKDHCEHYRALLKLHGVHIMCGPQGPVPDPWNGEGPSEVTELCPADTCALVEDFSKDCGPMSTATCETEKLAGCNPSCITQGCCGQIEHFELPEQMPPLPRPAVFLANGEGAIVELAEGVLIRPVRARAFGPLRPGTRLNAGDRLIIRNGARLEVRGERFRMSTHGALPSRVQPYIAPLEQSLFEAVSRRDARATERLIAGGAWLDVFDTEGRTPLMFAAINGDLATVQALVRAGANTGQRDPHRISALGYAHLYRQRRVFEWLSRYASVSLTRAESSLRALPPPVEQSWHMVITGPSAWVDARDFVRRMEQRQALLESQQVEAPRRR